MQGLASNALSLLKAFLPSELGAERGVLLELHFFKNSFVDGNQNQVIFRAEERETRTQ